MPALNGYLASSFDGIPLVIISVHCGESRSPYALPDASPSQGGGSGQPQPRSPRVLLCPTMMILMMRRSLYTTRHHHSRILDCNPILDSLHDFALKILHWFKILADPMNFDTHVFINRRISKQHQIVVKELVLALGSVLYTIKPPFPNLVPGTYTRTNLFARDNT